MGIFTLQRTQGHGQTCKVRGLPGPRKADHLSGRANPNRIGGRTGKRRKSLYNFRRAVKGTLPSPSRSLSVYARAKSYVSQSIAVFVRMHFKHTNTPLRTPKWTGLYNAEGLCCQAANQIRPMCVSLTCPPVCRARHAGHAACSGAAVISFVL